MSDIDEGLTVGLLGIESSMREQSFYELGNDIQLEKSYTLDSEGTPGTQNFCQQVYAEKKMFMTTLADLVASPNFQNDELPNPQLPSGNFTTSPSREIPILKQADESYDGRALSSLGASRDRHAQDTSRESFTATQKIIERLGIPMSILDRLEETRNIEALYLWQTECIAQSIGDSNYFDSDLIYTSPTSGGKTLVAELLLLHLLLTRPKGVLLFVLPFVALAEEKARTLSTLIENFARLNVIVECCVGKMSVQRIFQLKQTERSLVVVCTLEKGNQIVNEHFRRGLIGDIRLVVVDEVHLISENTRGHLLEVMITKLLYSRVISAEENTYKNSCNLILMSSWKSHAHSVFQWMNAVNNLNGRSTCYYETDFRPIPLDSFVVTQGRVLSMHGEFVRSVNVSAFHSESHDADLFECTLEAIADINQIHVHSSAVHDLSLCALIAETLDEHNQVLVFCATKQLCEATAIMIAQHRGKSPRENLPENDALHMFVQLVQRNFHVAPHRKQFRKNLTQALENRIAFHHAGLSHEERSAIEQLFHTGVIEVICCTTTLASGVNLPVRRVIFRSPLSIGKDIPFTPMGYNQASGRAGRAGLDVKGESYVLVQNKTDVHFACAVVQTAHGVNTDTVSNGKSSFLPDRAGLNIALLEAVDIGIVRSVSDIQNYLLCSQLSHTEGYKTAHYCAQAVLRKLEGNGILRWSRNAKEFQSTLLGKACVAALIPPVQGLSIFNELNAARDGLVLRDDLHLLFCVAPAAVQERSMDSAIDQADRCKWSALNSEILRVEPDWAQYYTEFYLRLSSDSLQTANIVGIEEGFLIHAQNFGIQSVGRTNATTADKDTDIRASDKAHLVRERHRRFYVALALQDIINEVPHKDIQTRFSLDRNSIAKLMESSSTVSSRLSIFCRCMNWWLLSAASDHLATRLSGGFQSELIDLMRVPSMTVKKARALFQKGIESVESLAVASKTEILSALAQVLEATGSRAHQVGAVEKLRNEARSIFQAETGELANHILGTHTINGQSSSVSIEKPVLEDFVGKSAHLAPANALLKREDVDPSGTFQTNSVVEIDCHHIALDNSIPCGNNFTAFCIAPIVDKSPHLRLIVLTDALQAHYSDIRDRQDLAVLMTWLDDASHYKVCDGWKGQFRTLLEFAALLSDSPSRMGFPTFFPAKVIDSSTYVFRNLSETNRQMKCIEAENSEKATSWKFSPPNSQLTNKDSIELSRNFESLRTMLNGVCQLSTQIDNPPRMSFLDEIDLKLSTVLAVMEYRGVCFNVDTMRTLQIRVDAAIRNIERQCHAFCSSHGVARSVQISKASDCARILYDILGYSPVSTKGGRIHRSTSNKALERIIRENPSGNVLFPQLLIDHRRLTYLKETYLKSIEEHIVGVPGRIHGVYRQDVTFSGRITMENPNLQMIQHSFTIDLDSVEGQLLIDPRSCFVASAQYILLSFDYMQIELRILASLSKDPTLTEKLASESNDFFRSLAEELFDIPVGEVTNELRRQAKAICYGILYGRGKKSLSEELAWSEERVEIFLQSFSEKYPVAMKYLQSVVDQSRSNGHVQLISGRRLPSPHILFSRKGLRRAVERSVVNAVFQGSAADIMKLALVNVHAFVFDLAKKKRAEGSEENSPWIVMQLHDEIIVEASRGDSSWLASAIREVMEDSANFYGLRIPVRVLEGNTWDSIRK
ncbi:DNA polymerase theta-like protein [Perkinsela sp. CCAP 1560/4]|nr:DNA polymerase theta-like protein [Perkinsela sp. CCAP 1560/4]|eukprot:KNH07625.1 DNA polymerase theta-like protein [Perkinsela sp. CCAP 1560/4]